MVPVQPYIGIDFGTSKCTVSWYNPRSGQAEVIRNAEGEEDTPSVVYFGERDEILVGVPAEHMLDEGEDPRRLVLSVKRDMVNAAPIFLPDRRVPAVEVAARIIGKLKADAEELHFHGPVPRAVVTHPAAFDLLQRDEIEKAARIAGFDAVELVEEPVAAALAYAHTGMGAGNRLLVYDLGAGTFDVAVLEREEDTFREAIPAQGIGRRGGNDFDHRLYEHLDEVAVGKLGQPLSGGEGMDPRLLRACRRLKESLSTRERGVYSVLLEDGTRFRHEVERATFEGLIEPYIEPTIRLTSLVLEEARRAGCEVDTVVLVGGSSRIPLVRKLLRAALPVEPKAWAQMNVAVGLGAAYHGHTVWRRETPREDPVTPTPPDTPVTIFSPKSATFTEHRGAITSLAFHADREWILSSSDDREAIAWPWSAGAPARLYFDQARYSGPRVSALSPDGRILAAVSSEYSIDLYEMPGKTRLGSLRVEPRTTGHPRQTASRIQALAFSRAGNAVAGGYTDGAIGLWYVGDEKVRRMLLGGAAEPRCLAFSPDDRLLASGDSSDRVILWDPFKAKKVATLADGSCGVSALAFSPRGDLLAVGYSDRSISLWDTRSRRMVSSFTAEHAVLSIVFSPQGDILASGTANSAIQLWNARTGELRQELWHSAPSSSTDATGPSEHMTGVSCLAFSPRGEMLASGSLDHTVKVWSPPVDPSRNHRDAVTVASREGEPGQESAQVPADLAKDHVLTEQQATSIEREVNVTSPEGRLRPPRLPSAPGSKQLLFEPLLTIPAHTDLVWSLAFSPDGQFLVSGSHDKTVRLWNPSSGQLLRWLEGHSDQVWSVAVSPDGRLVASGGKDRKVNLWNAQTGSLVRTLITYRGVMGLLAGGNWTASSLAFHPEGAVLVGGIADNTVRRWNISNGTEQAALKGHSQRVLTVAISSDGGVIASAGFDHTIRLWNSRTGQPLTTLTGHTQWVRSAQFHPTASMLASGSDDQTLRLWNLMTGEMSSTVAHDGIVFGVAFSPDGRLIASASADLTVKVWDLETGELLQTLEGHTAPVLSIAFSPSGHLLASGSTDRTIRIWLLDRDVGR